MTTLVGLSWLGKLVLYLERLHGSRTVRQLYTPAVSNEKLYAQTLAGVSLTIYCQKLHFQRKGGRWFVFSTNHYIYKLWAIASHDSSSKLKELVGNDVYLPPLLCRLVGETAQEIAVVNAYLDLLAYRLSLDG